MGAAIAPARQHSGRDRTRAGQVGRGSARASRPANFQERRQRPAGDRLTALGRAGAVPRTWHTDQQCRHHAQPALRQGAGSGGRDARDRDQSQRTLRAQLLNTGVTVVELAPPGVDTPLFRGEFAEETHGQKGMAPGELVRRAIGGIEKGKLEIRPGFPACCTPWAGPRPGVHDQSDGKDVEAQG